MEDFVNNHSTQPALTYEHTNGQVYEAMTAEDAQARCTFLGGMAIEDVRLLLELRTMGLDQEEAKPKALEPEQTASLVAAVEPESEIKKPETVLTPDQSYLLAQKAQALLLSRPDQAPDRTIELATEFQPPQLVSQIPKYPEQTVEKPQAPNPEPYEAPELFKNPEPLANQTEELLRVEEPVKSQEANAIPQTILTETIPLAIESTPMELDLSLPQELGSQEIWTFDSASINVGEQEPEEVRAETLDTVGDYSESALSVELLAPYEEIESVVASLAEVLENLNSQETDGPAPMPKILIIFEEIMTLPDNLELGLDDQEIDETLVGLYVELLEETKIDYNQEIIDSLVMLTKAYYLEQKTIKLDLNEQDVFKLPDQIGTREFLQKLNLGIGSMKKSVQRFIEIGKSVLALLSDGFQIMSPIANNF